MFSPRDRLQENFEHHSTDLLGWNLKPVYLLRNWRKSQGHGTATRTELTALESSARSKGFGLMTRRAAVTR
jgi:hypothetical protein